MQNKKDITYNDCMYLDLATLLDEYSDTNFYTDIYNKNTSHILAYMYRNTLCKSSIENLANRVNNSIELCIKFDTNLKQSDKLLFVQLVTNVKMLTAQNKEYLKELEKQFNLLDTEINKINLDI